MSASRGFIGDRGCIYTTGSFGRLDASAGSDLDGFIASAGNQDNREISRLTEIKIKADLIRAVETAQLPDFDGDGEYLAVFSESELVNSIGSRKDDYENTFTARLLMLLEGQPLPLFVNLSANFGLQAF